MPELPEVETIKNELIPLVVGKKITGVDISWERGVLKPAVDEFRTRIIGREIKGISRRGKYMIFDLDGETMVLHLRMTGSLLVNPSDTDDRYTRAVFHLGDTSVHFRDPRKFGVIWLMDSPGELDKKLGIEPLSGAFTPEKLGEIMGKRSAPVKALLLEQNLIAGIGNMYADEALYKARIHPERTGGSLTKDEIGRLHAAIRSVLKEAIGNKGASVRNYFRPGGELGTAHYAFKVAHRKGETCPVCGGPVKRIRVRNRGTYYCPRCQKLG